MIIDHAQVIARAWKDPAYKARLLANPKSALEELGFFIPVETEVKVVEDAPGTYTFVLPPPPARVRG